MLNMIDKSPQKIKEMFNRISSKYDLINNFISLGLHKIIKKCAVNDLLKDRNVNNILDCCTGTGDIALILKTKFPDSKITGIDVSPKMLELAKQKVKNVKFIEGSCTDLPFEDNSFDLVTIFFGLRNIGDYEKAISEIYRILKPGGEILYLDFGKSKYTVTIFNIIVNIVAKIFFQDIYPYRYLLKSKEEFMVEYDLVNEFRQKNIELIEQKKYVLNTILTLLLKKRKE